MSYYFILRESDFLWEMYPKSYLWSPNRLENFHVSMLLMKYYSARKSGITKKTLMMSTGRCRPKLYAGSNISQKRMTKNYIWSKFPFWWDCFRAFYPALFKKFWCSPVNLLHIFITPFPTNTSWGLLLNMLDKTIIEFSQNNKSYKFSWQHKP